jgi:hypothetical protein
VLFQPSVDLDLVAVKAALEARLSLFTCLTRGACIPLPLDALTGGAGGGGRGGEAPFYLRVVEVRPPDFNGVLVLDTDVVVDFIPAAVEAANRSGRQSGQETAALTATAAVDAFGDQFSSAASMSSSAMSSAYSSSPSVLSSSAAAPIAVPRQVDGAPVALGHVCILSLDDGSSSSSSSAAPSTAAGVVPVGESLYFAFEWKPTQGNETLLIELDSTPPLSTSSSSATAFPTSASNSRLSALPPAASRLTLKRTESYERRARGSDGDLYVVRLPAHFNLTDVQTRFGALSSSSSSSSSGGDFDGGIGARQLTRQQQQQQQQQRLQLLPGPGNHQWSSTQQQQKDVVRVRAADAAAASIISAKSNHENDSSAMDTVDTEAESSANEAGLDLSTAHHASGVYVAAVHAYGPEEAYFTLQISSTIEAAAIAESSTASSSAGLMMGASGDMVVCDNWCEYHMYSLCLFHHYFFFCAIQLTISRPSSP